MHGLTRRFGFARAGGDCRCGDLAPTSRGAFWGRNRDGDPRDGRTHDDRDGGRPAARAGTPLDPHEAFRRGLIDEKDDVTREEMRARLPDAHDLAVGLGTLWSFLNARDRTYNNRQPTPLSRTART